MQKSKPVFECALTKKERNWKGGREKGERSVCACYFSHGLWSHQLDDKLCITVSAGIRTLASRNDGCSGDPCKFAWVQNNCLSLLLKLFSLSLSLSLSLG